ncbi:hypothetical protein J437_LFUL009961 [Ladona fulva]|uniref:Uncharacterized protein n=1 Tax=Ladona fulva TaxID=123851 RepID=A0A8K0KA71_LADFU|nr:hypothetical protein J437_LFUL009961 [Ladona fulva]
MIAMSHQEESQSTPALLHMPTDSAMTGGSSTGGVSSIPGEATTSLGIIPENNLLESYTRLSISLEENGLFKVSFSDFFTPYVEDGIHLKLTSALVCNGLCCHFRVHIFISNPMPVDLPLTHHQGSSRSSSTSTNSHRMTLEELRAVNRYAESTKSLSYLPQVS